MKEASLRVLAYLALAIILTTFVDKQGLPTRAGACVFIWACIAVIGETTVIIRNVRHNRRARIEDIPTKELYVPETNKLPNPK